MADIADFNPSIDSDAGILLLIDRDMLHSYHVPDHRIGPGDDCNQHLA